MEITVLGTRGFPDVQGGVETHCENLYPRLVDLGCDVTVITRTPYIKKENRLSEWKGVKFKHLWCPKTKSLEALTHSLLGVFKAKNMSPDILHLHAIGPSLVAPLAKLLGCKIVLTHHGPDYKREKWGMLAKAVLRQGERHGVYFSDSIITISRQIQQSIKDKFNKDSTLIPNGVDIPDLISPGDELKKWNLEPWEYFFTASRLVPEKGLHDLIDAYKEINNPSHKLVIAGGADHETKYSRNIKKKARNSEGVVLTGFVSGKQLGELFSNAGIFVLPSYYEGLPISLLEAMSYGLPCIASEIPGNSDLIRNEEFLFEAGDTETLSSKMEHYMENPVNDKIPERNRHIIKTEYDWDNIAENTYEVYKATIA